MEASADTASLDCGEEEDVDVCSLEDEEEINSSFDSTNSYDGNISQKPKSFTPFSIDFLLQ